MYNNHICHWKIYLSMLSPTSLIFRPILMHSLWSIRFKQFIFLFIYYIALSWCLLSHSISVSSIPKLMIYHLIHEPNCAYLQQLIMSYKSKNINRSLFTCRWLVACICSNLFSFLSSIIKINAIRLYTFLFTFALAFVLGVLFSSSFILLLLDLGVHE